MARMVFTTILLVYMKQLHFLNLKTWLPVHSVLSQCNLKVDFLSENDKRIRNFSFYSGHWISLLILCPIHHVVVLCLDLFTF